MVTDLFVKPDHGARMSPVRELYIDIDGIRGSVRYPPLRQVLILSRDTIEEFELSPGDLQENIIISGIDIHALRSGTTINIGACHIRLTFHCEPCRKIAHRVSLAQIAHRRGVLGSFLNKGVICVGDEVVIGQKHFEEIPYNVGERIRWYLRKCRCPVSVVQLVEDVGLSRSYCRAIPAIVRHTPDIDPNMIIYGAH